MEIVNENFPKIARVNNNVCIGFSGDPLASLNALNVLQNYDVNSLTLEETKNIFINSLKNNNINKSGANVIVTGRNKSNNFSSYYIDLTNNYNEVYYKPKGNEFATIYALPAPEDNIHNYQKIVDDILKNNMPWNDLQDVQNCVIEAIDKISTLNSSVNDNIFMEVIT